MTLFGGLMFWVGKRGAGRVQPYVVSDESTPLL